MIRVREVRVISPEGEQLGILPIEQALELANEQDLDLVEVAPNERPPLCCVMDHVKLGQRLLDRIITDCKDVSSVEQHPRLEGQTLSLILAPKS